MEGIVSGRRKVSVDVVTAGRVPRYAMTEREAARFLGLSMYAFRRWVRPHCRVIRLGDGPRPHISVVAVDDLRDWFDRHAIRQEHRR
jgi:hypothetical protein